MGDTIRAGDLFAGRYRLTVLLDESGRARFWRARDEVLARSVALHLVDRTDPRAEAVMDAARRSARVQDRRLLRVLDADVTDDQCYVVSEWGEGLSLDLRLADSGPLSPRRSAWLVSEFADTLAHAHAVGEAHGRVVPENMLIDRHGQVRVIGFAIDAALRGDPVGDAGSDVADAGALLYAALTGRWPGRGTSSVAPAPTDNGQLLRARQVQAGVPRTLDLVCDDLLARGHRRSRPVHSAQGLASLLATFVGDPSDLLAREPDRPHRDALSAPATRGASDVNPSRGTPPAGAGTLGQPVVLAPDLPAVPSDQPGATSGGSAPSQESASVGRSQELSDVPTAAVPAADLLADHPADPDDPINDLSWLTPRGDQPPAPDLPEPEARPLFAPDPPPGQPQRRSRLVETAPGVVEPVNLAAAAGTAAAPPGEGRSHAAPGGAGDPEWPWDEHEEDGNVPGRTFFRLAVVVGILALVLLSAVAIKKLVDNQGAPARSPATSAQPTPLPEATEVKNLTVTDFDPEGSDGGESPSEVALATDGDPTTAWRTSGYYQNFTDRNRLKSGVGLLIDLGKPRAVSDVTVRVLGGKTSASVYLTRKKPDSVDGLEPIGSKTGLETLRFSAAPETRGRWLVVWLTSLPRDDGRYRGQVADIKVLARP